MNSTPQVARYRAGVADQIRQSFLTEDRQQVAAVAAYRRGTGGGPPMADVPQPDPDLLRKAIS